MGWYQSGFPAFNYIFSGACFVRYFICSHKNGFSNEKACFFCGLRDGLEHHEWLNGPDRRHAAQDGLWVWLCHRCHSDVQNDPEVMREGQKCSQGVFEKELGTREEFRKRYRKSYL